MDEDELPDPDPTPEQMRAFQALSPADIAEMDRRLLSHASTRFRKVAYVVGMSMMEKDDRFKGIFDIFFARRVAELVKAGRLESQGDLRRMRYSEVRLPEK
ncbi:hypothetical protein IZ6_00890 [Terrihabitans soli]|uniref:DUF3658 domain-containing protein n=2 Tax=Terrihabitans soli TaxID=708113 RepID=A0A6S6QGU8_9HYPH|nr:hypothetical protein IZ6_00890 [Terrihabitans soli]